VTVSTSQIKGSVTILVSRVNISFEQCSQANVFALFRSKVHGKTKVKPKVAENNNDKYRYPMWYNIEISIVITTYMLFSLHGNEM
jgi:hypothetical protein